MPRITADSLDEPVAVVDRTAPKPVTPAAKSDPLAEFLAYSKTRQAELDALSAKVQSNATATQTALAENAAKEVDPMKDKANMPKAPDGYTYKWIGSTAGGSWVLYKNTTSSSSGSTGGGGGGNVTPQPTGTDPATLALIKSLQDQLANQQAKAAADAAAQAAQLAVQREAAGKLVADRFSQYGLGSLASKIMDLARQGFTESTITLELQNSPEYQQRFAANQDRIKKGLAVLNPAEYISAEDAYRQTLRAYGLTQFDNDAYVRQFIANDVSAAELSSRVSIAVQRVQNADPTVTKTLRDFYGIGQSDMVAYILDPNQTLPKIQQQVAAAEIGSAARLQGLEAGVSVSEQLARQGISQAEAQKGYATIADILPSAEKLSQIYGGTMDTYGQAEAEQEVFNSLASAQRKRRALTAREVGTFSGSAGTSRGSLGQTSTGTF